MVSGASRDALVGVLGVVIIVGRSRLLLLTLFISVLIDCAPSKSLEPIPKLMLFLLSPFPNKPPRPIPLLDSFMDALSGLFGGLAPFLLEPTVKTSLILAPGETPRLLLSSAILRDLSLLLGSIVAACLGARFEDKDKALVDAGNVVDFWYCGF